MILSLINQSYYELYIVVQLIICIKSQKDIYKSTFYIVFIFKNELIYEKPKNILLVNFLFDFII